MFKRDTGQFFVIDEKGNSHDIRIKRPQIKTEPLRPVRAVSEHDIRSNYEQIMAKAKML